jgi:hypothetical protein
VESVTASQSTHVVVVLESVKADGARVSRLGQQLGRNSDANRIVIIALVSIVIVGGDWVFDVTRVSRLKPSQLHALLIVLLFRILLGGLAVGLGRSGLFLRR